MSDYRLFGIRHHGPGCARALGQALEAWQPDMILVEGPPDGDDVLALAAQAHMQPPVALMLYAPAHQGQSVYYPFTQYSPEWVAIRYGLGQGLPVRFMDLAYKVRVMREVQERAKQPAEEVERLAEEALEALRPHTFEDPHRRLEPEPADAADEDAPEEHDWFADPELGSDPMNWYARYRGFDDAESWWEVLIEERQGFEGLFEGIAEIMAEMRAMTELHRPLAEGEALREAAMRQILRAALKEGHARIAVVCGAWHVSALRELKGAAADQRLLKGLPTTPISATWIPWSYGRLAVTSGYGAGVSAPGWYDFLYRFHGQPRERLAIEWLARMAEELRRIGHEVSSAQLIDAVRLAQALAVLRNRSLLGLGELDEAMLTTACMGDPTALRVIQKRLLHDEQLGTVPDDVPQPPLVLDLAAQQKRLRMKVTAMAQVLDLDLRKDTDLARSVLLHRLRLLGVHWGEVTAGQVRNKGTFREVWNLVWDPLFSGVLVERATWGDSVERATTAFTANKARTSEDLKALTGMLGDVLLADLDQVLPSLLSRLQVLTAEGVDLVRLLEALPPLVDALRYGSVRRMDLSMLDTVVTGLVTRICVGIPVGVRDLDNDAAEPLLRAVLGGYEALRVLDRPAFLDSWLASWQGCATHPQTHPLLAGRAVRLLLDQAVDPEGDERRITQALSPGNPPDKVAAWLDGFLRHSGLVLVHDDRVFEALDGWLMSLGPERFLEALPLLRRTFSGFSRTERQSLGVRVRQGAQGERVESEVELDQTRASWVVPVVARLLGISGEVAP